MPTPPGGDTNAHDHRWHPNTWHHQTHHDEDPNMIWLRYHIEEIFSNHHLTDDPTGPHQIARIAALATAVTFLVLLFTLALTAPW